MCALRLSVSLGESVEGGLCVFIGVGQEFLLKYLEVRTGPSGSLY